MVGLDSNLNIIVQAGHVTHVTGYVLVQQYDDDRPAGWGIAKGKAYKTNGQRTTVLSGPVKPIGTALWFGMTLDNFKAVTGWAIPAPFL